MGHDSDLHKGPGMVPRDPMLERDYEELERSWARWKDLALKLERRTEKAEAERDALQADLDECWNAPLDEEVLTLRTRALREKAEAERDEAKRAQADTIVVLNEMQALVGALRTRVEALEGALRWLVNLAHDVGRAGGKPHPTEWDYAWKAARALLNTERKVRA